MKHYEKPQIKMQKKEITSIEDIAGVIETRRKSLDLSQQDLTLLSKIDRTWISTFETGKRKGITVKSLLKLTKSLRIKVILENEII